MTVDELYQLAVKLRREGYGDFPVWLASDPEGNDFRPLGKEHGIGNGVERNSSTVVLYPEHQ